MADNKEEQKRGRPKKQPRVPLVNEEPEVLQMSEKEKKAQPTQSIEKVRKNLNSFYDNLLNRVSNGTAWSGRLIDLQTYNPFVQNERLQQINTLPGTVSRDELVKILAAPTTQERALRSQGWALSFSQYLYYKILRFAADIPMFKYYKIPEYLEESKYIKKDFKEEDDFTDNWLTTFDLVNTFKRISFEVKREGKCAYVIRNKIDEVDGQRVTRYCTLQKLPSNFIKLTGIGQHGYTVSLDMMMFYQPGFYPAQYPEFIQKIWKEMVEFGLVQDVSKPAKSAKRVSFSVDEDKFMQFADTPGKDWRGILEIIKDSAKKSYAYWVPLPQEFTFVFCSDATHPWVIPDTAGLFLGLQELTDYDTLAGLVQSTPLTAILTAEAELIKDPEPGADQTALSAETIAGLQDKFNTMSSTNIEALFAPLRDFDLQSLPDVPNSSEITKNATQNFIDRAGLGGLLPVTDKPTLAQIRAAQLLEEAQCDFVTRQLESVLNYIVNNLIGCTYTWKINVWGNIFTFADEVKRTKEAWQAGATFMLPKLLSADNMNCRDSKAIELYVDSLGVYDHLKTVTQATQERNAEEVIELKNGRTSGAGRPSADVADVESDSTAKSIDNGTNTIEGREVQSARCCIICGEPCDGPVCDNCKEVIQERL